MTTKTEDELLDKVCRILGKWGLNDNPEYGLPHDIQALVISYTKQRELALLDKVKEAQIPVAALSARKPHRKIQIQAVPVEDIDELRKEYEI